MRFHPGPQKKPLRINTLSIVLYVLLLLFIVFTAHSFIKENNSIFLIKNDFINVNILTLNDSLTILIAIIGAIVARDNFAYSGRPYLVYETNGFFTDSRKRYVKLKNIGTGAAYIKRIMYRCVIDDRNRLKEIDKEKYTLTFDNVKEYLKSNNIIYKKHYTILEITNGYALTSSNGEVIIFVVNKEYYRRILAFDMQIEFKGMLKDTYIKEVFCIPRKVFLNQEDVR